MIPIPDKSAKTVANAIVREVFCRRGIPESFLTDRGCEFDNQALTAIAHELGIDKKRISPLRPQANGNVERLNRTIGNMLSTATNGCGEDWDLEIPFVQFNYVNYNTMPPDTRHFTSPMGIFFVLQDWLFLPARKQSINLRFTNGPQPLRHVSKKLILVRLLAIHDKNRGGLLDAHRTLLPFRLATPS